MVAYRWKSWSAKAVAGRPKPSLAGVAVTQGPKRRQGSYGVCQYSLERSNIVEAELVPVNEGSMYAIARRDGSAPPGSKPTSRTKGSHWNPGDPAGSIGVVSDGGQRQGMTGVSGRAEAGDRTGS